MTLHYWIETDLEPDDVLALAILPTPYAWVVGEGDASIKARRMQAYKQMLAPGSGARVVRGFDSDKPFIGDGDELDILPSLEGVTDDYRGMFRAFLSQPHVYPVIISLKPMRELLAWYRESPEEVSKLLECVVWYGYGGFNFRCLLREYNRELPLMLQCFHDVKIYESFYATGQRNSVNKENCPWLYHALQKRQKNPYFAMLTRLTHNWNLHLLAEMENAVEKTDEEAQKRRQKVIDSIRGHESFQYVLADFALAAVYKSVTPKPVKNLRFVHGYTTFDDGPDTSKIHVYRDINFESLEQMIVAELDARC